MTTREALHHLVDSLPEPALWRAERLLTALEEEEAALPAVLRDAPIEEPEEDEIAALAAIDRDAPDVSHEDARRELEL
jgi:hypothetical protein